MSSRLTVEYYDFDRDRIQTSIDGIAFLPDGTDFTTQRAKAVALADALAAVTIGTESGRHITTDFDRTANPTVPASGFAQSNTQWRAIYRDTIDSKEYSVRVGTADLAQGSLVDGETVLDLSAGAGLALKTAWDAYAVHVVGGSPRSTVLVRVEYVE